MQQHSIPTTSSVPLTLSGTVGARCDGGRRCTYRSAYLRRGPASLSHHVYHTKETILMRLCHQAMVWDQRKANRAYPHQHALDVLAAELRV